MNFKIYFQNCEALYWPLNCSPKVFFTGIMLQKNTCKYLSYHILIESFRKLRFNWYYLNSETNVMRCAIWYHLYNLKKREKHPWRSVNFRKVACNNGFALSKAWNNDEMNSYTINWKWFHFLSNLRLTVKLINFAPDDHKPRGIVGNYRKSKICCFQV